jgi:hypothetical protein
MDKEVWIAIILRAGIRRRQRKWQPLDETVDRERKQMNSSYKILGNISISSHKPTYITN